MNLTVQLENQGIFKKYGIKVLGASPEAISKAEDRELFKEAMLRVGIDVPQSDRAYSLDEAKEVANRIGFPLVIRPSFTLGGTGGSIAYNIEEFENLAQQALESSIIREILIEESVIGWKEIELIVIPKIMLWLFVQLKTLIRDSHWRQYYHCTRPNTHHKNTTSRDLSIRHSRNWSGERRM